MPFNASNAGEVLLGEEWNNLIRIVPLRTGVQAARDAGDIVFATAKTDGDDIACAVSAAPMTRVALKREYSVHGGVTSATAGLLRRHDASWFNQRRQTVVVDQNLLKQTFNTSNSSLPRVGKTA